jgi:hypothetical protein
MFRERPPKGAWFALLFLLPVGLALTVVDWVFNLFPEPASNALSVLTVAACFVWAWRLQRRDRGSGAVGRHRRPQEPLG